MTPRIEKAINILLDALNSGGLQKGSCTKCGIGNLIKHGMPGGFDDEIAAWTKAFGTINYHGARQFINKEYFKDEDVVNCVNATDFTLRELIELEFAFESNTTYNFPYSISITKNDIKKDQIKGLEAMVKAMLKFDSCRDEVKKIFTNRAEIVLN